MTAFEVSLTIALAVAVGVLAVLAFRVPHEALARAIQSSPDVVVLRTHVEGLTQAQAALQQSVSGLQDTLRGLETKLVETGSGIKGDLSRDLQEARRVIDEIRTVQESRKAREAELQQAVTRIEAVLAGYGRRGEAGEQIIAAALKQFPAGMIEQGFRIDGKEVEFALVLPNGRRLPVDSKWTAGGLLQRLAELEAGPEAEALATEIERNVVRRAREAKQYVRPPETLPWAVVAVPDPAYAVCRSAHLEAYREGVILLPYSLTVPYLLSLYQLQLQYGGEVDLERLASALIQIERSLGNLETTLENSVARATTMLQNAYGELKRLVADVRGLVAGLKAPGRNVGPTEEE
jgi:DNA recombination protein RmuC